MGLQRVLAGLQQQRQGLAGGAQAAEQAAEQQRCGEMPRLFNGTGARKHSPLRQLVPIISNTQCLHGRYRVWPSFNVPVCSTLAALLAPALSCRCSLHTGGPSAGMSGRDVTRPTAALHDTAWRHACSRSAGLKRSPCSRCPANLHRQAPSHLPNGTLVRHAAAVPSTCSGRSSQWRQHCTASAAAAALVTAAPGRRRQQQPLAQWSGQCGWRQRREACARRRCSPHIGGTSACNQGEE